MRKQEAQRSRLSTPDGGVSRVVAIRSSTLVIGRRPCPRRRRFSGPTLTPLTLPDRHASPWRAVRLNRNPGFTRLISVGISPPFTGNCRPWLDALVTRGAPSLRVLGGAMSRFGAWGVAAALTV